MQGHAGHEGGRLGHAPQFSSYSPHTLLQAPNGPVSVLLLVSHGTHCPSIWPQVDPSPASLLISTCVLKHSLGDWGQFVALALDRPQQKRPRPVPACVPQPYPHYPHPPCPVLGTEQPLVPQEPPGAQLLTEIFQGLLFFLIFILHQQTFWKIFQNAFSYF